MNEVNRLRMGVPTDLTDFHGFFLGLLNHALPSASQFEQIKKSFWDL